MGYGLWAMGSGQWAVGYGLWAVGMDYGQWAMDYGYGLCALGAGLPTPPPVPTAGLPAFAQYGDMPERALRRRRFTS